MSFTSDVKDELSHIEPVCSHCDKATLAALVRVEGSLMLSGKGRYRLEIDTEIPSVARLVIKLIHNLYRLHTELTVRRNVLHKTPNYLITVPCQPKLEGALLDLGVLGDAGFVTGLTTKLVGKDCCTIAYLRGIFLGSGFIADPRGDFHFEMTIEYEDLANDIVALLEERGIHARIMPRRNSFLIYIKSGSVITEFLALVGAHRSALYMENARVVKSVRNDVNRRVNAELANQAKASAASVQQMVNIRKVVDHYGMDNIPPALQSFIRLRVENPDDSLKELGEKADPPLSKSAIAHRVRRIEEMAAEIGKENE